MGPFALPSTTVVRFVLLVVATTAAVFSSSATYWRISLEDSVFPLAGFWAAVFGLYWMLPRLRIRFGRLVSLSTAGLPHVQEEVARLRKISGVSNRVVFLVNMADPRPSGIAFGRFGRRYVLLRRGTIALWDNKRRAQFRAIVLHELAHIRNRDIDMTYLTVAIWLLFIAVVLPLHALAFLGVVTGDQSTDTRFFVGAFVWQLVLLAVLIPATAISVLRSREGHADARAATWPGAYPGLTKLFAVPERETLFARLLRTHPRPVQRQRALHDPQHLMALGMGEAFSTAVAAALSYDMVFTQRSGSELLPPDVQPLTLAFAGIVLLAVLLAFGLGLGAWRTSLGAHVGQGRPPRFGRMGWGFGLGLAVGGMLSPNHVVIASIIDRSLYDLLLVQALILLVVGWAFTRWVGAMATAWVPAVFAAPSAEGRVRERVVRASVVIVSLALACVGLAAVLLVVFPLYIVASVATHSVWSQIPAWLVFFAFPAAELIAVFHVPAYFFLLACAAFPLLGTVLATRHRAGEVAAACEPLPGTRRTLLRGMATLPGARVGVLVGLISAWWVLVGLIWSAVIAPRMVAFAVGELHAITVLVPLVHGLAAFLAVRCAADQHIAHGILAGGVLGLVLVPATELGLRAGLLMRMTAHGRPAQFDWSMLWWNALTQNALEYRLPWSLFVATAVACLTSGLVRRPRMRLFG